MGNLGDILVFLERESSSRCNHSECPYLHSYIHVLSWGPADATASCLLFDLETVILPPTPAAIEFHHGVALAREYDRCIRGQVADV
jgi:hypothetical protein